ncbi:MAG TPA: class I SAM-dependent methyltransferase, partial [Pyrinomonadaceae bacterium]|nr:class I SAM-dependent methyltransferase [Pyrinomonadaceae bacterium]
SRRAKAYAQHISLLRGNILDLPFKHQFDAILCRGVLNDLIDDESRGKVFVSFADALRQGGVLIFDVREWNETVERKRREPIFEKSVKTPKGHLMFRSETRLDNAQQRLLVAERHVLNNDGRETVSDYEFIMRCWTEDELQHNLSKAGFVDMAYSGDYSGTIPVGASDRLVCVASRT